MAHPGGRPTLYTDELAQEICKAIATSGHGLKKICEENPHFPVRETILVWCFEKPEFSHMYREAKRHQAWALNEECLEISDDKQHDTLVKYDKNGESYEVQNSEWINRSRLRVETRKWQIARLEPKYFGDRIHKEVEATGNLLEKIIDKL